MPPNNQPPESIRKLMEVADYTKYLRNNFAKYPVQRYDAGGTVWEAINNAWVRNNIACHIHVGLEACGADSHAHDLCILFHKPSAVFSPGALQPNDFAPGSLKELKYIGVSVGKHCYRGYHLVFIGVGEIPEPGQRVQEDMGLVEMTLVGLMPVDDCPVFRSEFVERPTFLEAPRVRELGRRAVLDGELDLIGVAGLPSPSADETKLPDQVIEGGSGVVGDVPDDDSEPADGIFRECRCRPEDVIAATRLKLTPHGYSVGFGDGGTDLRPAFAVKLVEVLFGPLDFSPDTGEVRLVAHS